MIKLIGDGNVLIKEFETEEEGLEYIKKNKDNLWWYYSRYELVVPGEKTIWNVSENLIPAEEYQNQLDKKRHENYINQNVKEEDWED